MQHVQDTYLYPRFMCELHLREDTATVLFASKCCARVATNKVGRIGSGGELSECRLKHHVVHSCVIMPAQKRKTTANGEGAGRKRTRHERKPERVPPL
eukprot:4305582-Amphidinium_carterae.1